jgi:urocanate reductase
MGTGFISTYVDVIAKDDKIDMVTSTTANELMVDDSGAVVGVKATDTKGNHYTYTATKGVILATGGFAANSKMIAQYNTSDKWAATDLSKVKTTNRFSCSQGDGINMALAAGASLTQMDQIQLLYLGNTKDGSLTKYPPRCVNGTDQEIFINKNGERFVQEDGRRDVICLGVLAQPDSMFYFLESADGNYTDVNTAMSADGFPLRSLEEQGYVYIADTLEEMAQKLGMDYATLQATVDKFNASVDSGSDEFGRTLFSVKLENGPWVATPRTACLHHTMGGVTIDTSCRVQNADGAAIKGLYAAGEVTGGIHGANRLGGNAVVDTVVFGKLAGETVVSDNK